jgi:phosphopantetheine--protein transferase-like protein
MITVYALDVRGIDPDGDAAVTSLLSEARRQRMGALKRKKDRMLSAGAELAFLALKTRLGLGAYAYDQKGRPFMQDVPYNICFTHSGMLAACAVSDVPAGIDAELIRETSPALNRAVFAEPEYASYAASEDPCRFLIETWTAKESYFKLTGEGISKAGLQSVYREASKIKDAGGGVRAHLDTRILQCEAETYSLCVASYRQEKPAWIFESGKNTLSELLKRT